MTSRSYDLSDAQVANRPFYVALGATVDGQRDILGLLAGEQGDGENEPQEATPSSTSTPPPIVSTQGPDHELQPADSAAADVLEHDMRALTAGGGPARDVQRAVEHKDSGNRSEGGD